LPGAEAGYQGEDPTIANCFKPLGYRTGQFGKEPLSADTRRASADDATGFDEFLRNLWYHLNGRGGTELRD